MNSTRKVVELSRLSPELMEKLAHEFVFLSMCNAEICWKLKLCNPEEIELLEEYYDRIQRIANLMIRRVSELHPQFMKSVKDQFKDRDDVLMSDAEINDLLNIGICINTDGSHEKE